MALALVQIKTIGSGTLSLASPVTTNTTMTATTGNLLAIAFRCGGGGAITSISDPGSNTYSPLTIFNPFGVPGQFWYAKNITGFVAGNITVNYSPTPANNPFGIVWEISGADAGNPFDAQTNGSGSATSVTSGTLSTNFANEIVLAMAITNGSNSPYVVPSGFTADSFLPQAGPNLTLGHASHEIVGVLQSTTLTYSWTVTSGTTASSIVVASFVASPRPVTSGGGWVNRERAFVNKR